MVNNSWSVDLGLRKFVLGNRWLVDMSLKELWAEVSMFDILSALILGSDSNDQLIRIDLIQAMPTIS